MKEKNDKHIVTVKPPNPINNLCFLGKQVAVLYTYSCNPHYGGSDTVLQSVMCNGMHGVRI